MSISNNQLTLLTADDLLLRRIVSKLPGMVAYWDTEQRCRFANADYERWFGVKPENLIGKTMKDLLGPIYTMNLPYIQGALRGEVQFFEREIPGPAGGPSRYSQTHYIPDVLNGIVEGFVVLVSDISGRRKLELELREAQERASALATHDFLTGLPNRVLLVDRLSRAIEASKRHRRQFAVLYLDLDGFKNVNDSLGHGAGDSVLCEVARRLVGALRSIDTVARIGGDEFVILLPEVGGRDQAGDVARKLLATMAREPFIAGEQSPAMTMSIGISFYPDHGSKIHELLAHADNALYAAKLAGKNQFAFFAPGR
jgi:diguanylate cyclase (GGDEF)-like protein/PAS domain S-box-containing protein